MGGTSVKSIHSQLKISSTNLFDKGGIPLPSKISVEGCPNEDSVETSDS